MGAAESLLDQEAESILSRQCLRPINVGAGVWVRCGSRVKSRCRSCAELYRKDWAAIARSGVFDGPVQDFRFYLLTLTAPSFGAVHRVPRSAADRLRLCGCGAIHSVADGSLRGVPLDPRSYDYAGQVAWNRDGGVLWDRTRRRVRDRWDSMEFFIVREWQDRGVLHMHALVRIDFGEAPSSTDLGAAARTAEATSKVDGSLVRWGAQHQCDEFPVSGAGARAIWYLSKALNYVMKDTAREGLGGGNGAWEHLAALQRAARSMKCSPACDPANCRRRLHDNYGSRSHVVSASRRTKYRTGWSFTGLTRTVQRRLRREWFEAQGAPVDESAAEAGRQRVRWAVEWMAERARREFDARAAAVP
jgi:hypothetical protein